MKIAVCISGADRCFQFVVDELIKNIIEPLNADVFIHAWDSNSFSDRFSKNDSNEEIYKKISKKYEIEKFDSNWNFINANKPRNIVPMFYSIYKSFSLVPDDYDIVIRSRFDALYTNKFILPKIKKNHVYVQLSGLNKGRFAARRNFIHEGTSNLKFVADNFAIGDYYSMQKYCTTYLNLNNLKTFLPETCLAEQLDNNNIKYEFLDELNYMALSFKENNNIIFESDYLEKKSLIYNF